MLASRERAMSRGSKTGIVLVGYVLAFLAALAATAIRVAFTSGPDAQASSGMYAGGDLLLFLGVFGSIALFPTGAALAFLRARPWFGPVLAGCAAAIAVSGVMAVYAYLVFAPRDAPVGALIASALAVLRLLGSPLVAVGQAGAAILAPSRGSRRVVLAALGVEVATLAFGVHRFLVLPAR